MIKSRRENSGQFQWSFFLPKYWGIWFALPFILISAVLPWAIQWRIAQFLVNPAWKYLKRRKKITMRNIEICFQDKSPKEVEKAVKDVFFNMLIGYFEALNAWYSPNWFNNRVSIKGLEHIENVKNKGILLLSTHTTLLDAGGYISSLFFELDVVYRPQNNRFLDWLIYYSRKRAYKNQISKNDMKQLIRSLKDGRSVWYSPDQDFGLKQGVMVPFFGVYAATITAHRRIMQMSNSVAIPLYFYRTGKINDPHYHILIEPMLDNFPSSCEVSDATRVNNIFEAQILIEPMQYMWVHRRFKTRPEGFEKIYLD